MIKILILVGSSLLLILGIIMQTQTDSPKIINATLTTEELVQDPILAKGYQQFQVLNLYLDTLVRKHPEVGIVSGIAKKWSVSEDKKTYVFEISHEAVFHNGKKISSEDVVFSMNRHLDPKSSSFVGSYLRNVVENVSAPSNDVVEFNLKGPYPPFLELVAMSGFGIISTESMGDKVIGSGPYQFSELPLKDKNWCLDRFKGYLFRAPKIDRFCFRVERDVDRNVALLKTGEINLSMGAPLEVALSPEVENSLVTNPMFSMVSTHAYFNLSKPTLLKRKNRARVAKALSTVKSEILTKFDSPLSTFIPSGIMNEGYYRDHRDEDNESNETGGTKDKITVVFPYGIFLKESVEKIVSRLQEHGFEVSYSNVKGKELLDPLLAGDFDIIFLPYQGVVPDPDGYLDLLSPNSALKAAQIPTSNLLSSLESVRFTSDRKQRLEDYSRTLRDWEKELFVIPFTQNGIPVITDQSVKLPDLNYSFHLSLRELDISK